MVPALAALALFVVSILLWRPLPRSRGRFRSVVVLLMLWAACKALRTPYAADTATALIEIAALEVAAALVFETAVYRARAPHLVVEGFVVAGYVAIVVGLLVRLGVNVTGIFATSAVATAVLGLALQDTLNNIAGGVSLELEGEIKVGDYVRCAEASGWVRHIRLRHTAIDTADGERVILPNSFLTRTPVAILAHARRQFVPFTMPYAQNPQEVTEAVTAGLQASPIQGVAADPAPYCVVQEMAPGHVRYAAVAWFNAPGAEEIATSGVLSRICFALRRAGVEAAEISYLLELKQAAGMPGPRANPVDVLRSTPIFRLLDDSGLFELGARLHHVSFGPGEIIIRQGEEGDSMYLVTAGQVSINLVNATFGERQVSIIGPGDFFGETSLLTGERRNANVVALSRVDCYRLDKAGLEDVIARRPELAEDMSVVLAHRQTELNLTRETLDREAALRREAESQAQLLTLIRRFFGLDETTSRRALLPPRPAGPLRSRASSPRE